VMRRIRRSSLRYSVVKVRRPDRLGVGGGPARVRPSPLVRDGPRPITCPRDTAARHIHRRAAREADAPCSTIPFGPSLFVSSSTSLPGSGGDEGTRTPDFCFAKAALSQLSYIPTLPQPSVGLSGFEPETFPLSEERSNQLS
jgi:hypothetical protein